MQNKAIGRNTKKKVAIITLYDDYNIGNKLQNYALQESIKAEGYACETVDTRSFGRWRLTWRGWLATLLGVPRKVSHHRRMMLRRKPRFHAFSQQYLNVCGPYSYRSILGGSLRFYDAFVCGSDQVWHRWTRKPRELDYFFLRFTEQRKRICYAPSFGFDDVPEKDREIYCQGLMGFDRLSCREQSGCALIRALTGREAELLCDPTMLLTTKQWDQIILKPEFPVPKKYVMTYFLGPRSEQTRLKIEDFAKKQGLAVVNVYCMEVSAENDIYFCTRPDEFLYLIKHASYVCTDSFHGAVFSILYHKKFTTFQRTDGSTMQGRLQTLLSLFRLEQRNNIEEMGQPIDFLYADEILAAERKKGMCYLHETLAEATRNDDT